MPCSGGEPKGEPEQPGPEVDPYGVEAEQGTDDGQAAQLEYEVGDVEREHRPDPDDLLPQRQRLLVGQEVADASLAHHYHRHPNAEQLDVRRLPGNIGCYKIFEFRIGFVLFISQLLDFSDLYRSPRVKTRNSWRQN